MRAASCRRAAAARCDAVDARVQGCARAATCIKSQTRLFSEGKNAHRLAIMGGEAREDSGSGKRERRPGKSASDYDAADAASGNIGLPK